MGDLVLSLQLARSEVWPSTIPTLPFGAASAWLKELEQAQDDAFVLIRATLDKVKERIEGMDPEELVGGADTGGAADAG